LSEMATIIPGVALWAFCMLTVMLTVIVSFNPRYLWQLDESGQLEDSGHLENSRQQENSVQLEDAGQLKES
jgi:paraquat-inducible protein A